MSSHRNKILSPGVVVDARYRIQRLIGRGGFATVYRAEHVHLRRDVALKLLDTARFDGDEDVRDRFLSEARLAAQLDSPHVVRIQDFGFHENQPYLVMELLEGKDLDDVLLERGALMPRRAVAVARQCLRGLAAAHDRGIIHKDLKPSNVFIVAPGTPQERAVVLDFGLAAAREASRTARATDEDVRSGTPQYLPPEYIDAGDVSAAMDVYQMALIFVEMLTGHPVVQHTHIYRALYEHTEGALPIPFGLLVGPFGTLLSTALAPDPGQRFENAGACLEAFERVDVDDPSHARWFERVAARGELARRNRAVENAPTVPRDTPLSDDDPPEQDARIMAHVDVGEDRSTLVLHLGDADGEQDLRRQIDAWGGIRVSVAPHDGIDLLETIDIALSENGTGAVARVAGDVIHLAPDGAIVVTLEPRAQHGFLDALSSSARRRRPHRT